MLFLFNATELKAPAIETFLEQNPLLPASLLTIIAVVGLLVLGYIINIRYDTLLYARTVNGIRKYFYQRSGISIEEEIHIRTLPRTTGLPLYEEKSYFLFVVLAFTALGTSYFAGGWLFYWTENKWPLGSSFWLLIGAFAWGHVTTYALLCRYRERWYLRGHIFGIDIDGVLNDHRHQFCDVLHAKTGKVLDPEFLVGELDHTLQRFAATVLIGVAEAERKKFDYGCLVQRDMTRPLVAQVLWAHAGGIDKDLRALLLDSEAVLKIYLVRATTKHLMRVDEVIRSYRADPAVGSKLLGLRLIKIPGNFDADSEAERTWMASYLQERLTNDTFQASYV